MGAQLSALLGTVKPGSSVGVELVGQLRRAVYDDGQISADEARRLLAAHRNGVGGDPVWDGFLIDTLCDHFVHQTEPYAALSPQDARALTEAFRADGIVCDRIELVVLTRILNRSTTTPPEFAAFVRAAVHDHIRVRGWSNDALSFVRACVYGEGTPGQLFVNRQEADWLLSLAELQETVFEPFGDLLKKAIAMTVLYWGNSPERIDRFEAGWLKTSLETLKKNAVGVAYAHEIQRYLQAETQDIDSGLESVIQNA